MKVLKIGRGGGATVVVEPTPRESIGKKSRRQRLPTGSETKMAAERCNNFEIQLVWPSGYRGGGKTGIKPMDAPNDLFGTNRLASS